MRRASSRKRKKSPKRIGDSGPVVSETEPRRSASNKQEDHMKKFATLFTVALLLVGLSTAFAQKKSDSATRSVEGVVSQANDAPAVGAVVQLENTKTQQIRSFITKEDGKYHFYELSTEVDYKLKAEQNGMS